MLQARAAAARGDMNAADNAARTAKMCVFVSYGIGLAGIITVAIVMAVYFGILGSSLSQ